MTGVQTCALPICFPDDANHRFTTDIALYNVLVGLGWDGEGVKACLPL